MPEGGNALSRNPNICASCSSLADGMEEITANEVVRLHSEMDLAREKTKAPHADRPADKAA